MYTINFAQIMEDLPELMADIQADLEADIQAVMNEEYAINCENQLLATFGIAA
jgi:hypothetical protein